MISQYSVRARNEAGDGPYSSTATATISTEPDAPTSLRVTSSTHTSVTIAWNAPANDGFSPLDGYQIKRTGGGPAQDFDVDETQLSYTDSTVQGPTTYTVRYIAHHSYLTID